MRRHGLPGIMAMATVAVLVAGAATGVRAADLGDWKRRLSDEHPRMFLNREALPALKTYVREHEAGYYGKVRGRVRGIPAEPNREACEKGSQKLYGPYAQQAALVWLVEGDRDALQKARNYLLAGVKFYNRCTEAGEPVNWYSASRVQALTAYDWIHGQLSPKERQFVVRGMLKHWSDWESMDKAGRFNRGGIQSGFYGPPNLPWYLGLAFHKDGVADAEAARLLERGFNDHVALLRYRAKAAGDDGGIGSVAVGYGLGMYPWSEFNFMHTFDSATGLSIEEHFDHLSLLPNWVLWNWLPGGMSWGLADSVPAGRMPQAFLGTHMMQIAHFYADEHPERARFALWVRDELLGDQPHDDYWWPVAPLLLTRCGDLPGPKGPDDSWPQARNFESMGVVMMNAGRDTDDVHAAFVAGGDVNQHRHYDQGHFIIFRRNHLAIDSGDYGPRSRNSHLTEYLYRTVAHNSLLIHAPASADRPAKVWGGPAKTLDGGQSKFGGRQIAFETNPLYTYAAADASGCYDRRKCKAAVRQFVFLRPDTFVICDRVVAAQPEFRKQWLLHGVNEPQLSQDGRSFRFGFGGSTLTGRTLLPVDARAEAVGGPGKRFLSGGKNWPQEGEHKELAGSWRIEVSPGQARAGDAFLHVLRAGDEQARTLGGVRTISADGIVGAALNVGGREVTVRFNTRGKVGGHIRVGGAGGVDRKLATDVQPQGGVPGEHAGQ